MLKTRQILGCSSGLVSHRWKPYSYTGSRQVSFISISTCSKPLLLLSSSSSSSTILPTTTTLLLPGSSPRRTRLGAFSMSSAHSGPNPGGPSSSVAVHSAVSFFWSISFRTDGFGIDFWGACSIYLVGSSGFWLLLSMRKWVCVI